MALVATVGIATVLPCRGEAARTFAAATAGAIGLLFFLHGARLSKEAILAGIGHWRLHLTVLATTFVLFPLLGVAVRALSPMLVPPAIAAGILYLCLLPSTIQSSVAFTSIAGGNVVAAICTASASNLLGIFITPLLAALLMGASGRGGNLVGAVEAITAQLFLPFAAGHLLRPLIGPLIDRHRRMLGIVDRGSILLIVYTAFSAAVVEGLWHNLGALDLAEVLAWDATILAAALAVTRISARALGFPRADEIAIVFCGSKKSLAAGVPMAGVLFPAASVGALIVPIMFYHQIQLMACAAIARRYARGRAGAVYAPPERSAVGNPPNEVRGDR